MRQVETNRDATKPNAPGRNESRRNQTKCAGLKRIAIKRDKLQRNATKTPRENKNQAQNVKIS